MSPALQRRFDALLQDAINALPPAYARLLEEIPIVAEDRPSAALVAELKKDGVIPADAPPDDDELCGLHSGVAITEQSVESSGQLPPTIHVFREGIVSLAGGWDQDHADDEIYEEVRITLLHEMGHHFGLDEDDLDALGYA
ncbi:MAG: metallopeptidase family protein [Phycisphaerales bacterium]